MKYSIDQLKATDDSNIVQQDFILTTGLKGATSLKLSLSINIDTSEFIGTGTVFQATNPPLNLMSSVSGKYIPLLVMGAPQPLFIGTGIQISTPLYENLDFSFQLNGDNNGRFKYRTSMDSDWITVENAHVEQVNN